MDSPVLESKALEVGADKGQGFTWGHHGGNSPPWSQPSFSRKQMICQSSHKYTSPRGSPRPPSREFLTRRPGRYPKKPQSQRMTLTPTCRHCGLAARECPCGKKNQLRHRSQGETVCPCSRLGQECIVLSGLSQAWSGSYPL